MTGWQPYGMGLAPAPNLFYHKKSHPVQPSVSTSNPNDPEELVKLPINMLQERIEELGGTEQNYRRFTTKRELVDEIGFLLMKRESVQQAAARKHTEDMDMKEVMRRIEQMQSQKWNCSACTFENSGETARCQICRTPRPGGAS